MRYRVLQHLDNDSAVRVVSKNIATLHGFIDPSPSLQVATNMGLGLQFDELVLRGLVLPSAKGGAEC